MNYELRVAFMAIFAYFAVNIAIAQSKTTTVEFDTRTHNFGRIEEAAGTVSHTFSFKNTGSAPLVINAVNVTCGCTTPTWNRAPVMPGKEGTITVAYDPEGRPGVFDKPVSVIANIEGQRVVLTLKGTVNLRPRTINEDYPFSVGSGLRVAERSVIFGNLTRGVVNTSSLKIANDSDSPIKIGINRYTLPSYIQIEPAKTTLAPKERSEIAVKIDASKSDKWGEIEFSYGFIINGIPQNIQIANRGVFVENFGNLTKEQLRNAPRSDYSSYFYHFSECARGAKLEHEFYVSNSGTSDLIIRFLDFDNTKMSSKTNQNVIKQGQTATITVSLKNTDKSGRIGESVRVITNDPENPVRDIRVMAIIK